MSNRTSGIIIQAPKVPTILHVDFPNGRTMQVPINPIESTMRVAPNGSMYTEVLATIAVPVPAAPMGITIIPHGTQWSAPDQVTVVGQFPLSPTETDLIIRHGDGSAETIRMQHPPGAKIAMNQPVPQPRADLVGVTG